MQTKCRLRGNAWCAGGAERDGRRRRDASFAKSFVKPVVKFFGKLVIEFFIESFIKFAIVRPARARSAKTPRQCQAPLALELQKPFPWHAGGRTLSTSPPPSRVV